MSDIFVFSRLKRDSNGNLRYCSVSKGYIDSEYEGNDADVCTPLNLG